MTADLLRTLYGYDGWATRVLLDVAEGLPAEQWLAPASTGMRPIRDTFVHLCVTQQRWRSWWDGSLPVEEAIQLTLDPAQFVDVVAVRALIQEQRAALDAFVAGLSDADANRPLNALAPSGERVASPLWQTMLHLANHGTQHRSEIAAQLSDLGRSPGSLDLMRYLWR
jgi:uncharacterized damage-inducible protein DinB